MRLNVATIVYIFSTFQSKYDLVKSNNTFLSLNKRSSTLKELKTTILNHKKCFMELPLLNQTTSCTGYFLQIFLHGRSLKSFQALLCAFNSSVNNIIKLLWRLVWSLFLYLKGNLVTLQDLMIQQKAKHKGVPLENMPACRPVR